MVRRMRTLNTVVVAALATAGIAAAAAGDVWPCHPDLPGTRSLTVTGHVISYRFAGRGTLVASVRTKRCAGVARWGGEEFVVVLPETDLAGAQSFA
jgi:hypothetical protein